MGFLRKKDLKVVRARAKDRRSAKRLALRCKVLLGWHEGLGASEISRRTGVSRPTIYSWKKWYERGGLARVGVIGSTIGSARGRARSRASKRSAPGDAAGKAPTCRRIAEIAGVSRTTVSLALRNSPKVSAPLRERIQDIARRLDYRRNPFVSANMSYVRSLREPQYHATIGYICENFARRNQKGSMRWLLYEGISQRAARLGYGIEVFDPVSLDMNYRRMSAILVSRGIHGVIIAPFDDIKVGSMDLNWPAFAPATFGLSLVDPLMIHRACSDNYQNMDLLLKELAHRGYNRIGFYLLRATDYFVDHRWRAAFMIYQNGISVADRIPMMMAESTDRRLFLDWYRDHRPEVVVSSLHELPVWLKEEGYRIPEDVGVATVYWLPGDPFLSGFYQNFGELGAATVDLVTEQIHRNDRGLPKIPKTVLMPGTWMEGGSLREPPASADSD